MPTGSRDLEFDNPEYRDWKFKSGIAIPYKFLNANSSEKKSNRQNYKRRVVYLKRSYLRNLVYYCKAKKIFFWSLCYRTSRVPNSAEFIWYKLWGLSTLFLHYCLLWWSIGALYLTEVPSSKEDLKYRTMFFVPKLQISVSVSFPQKNGTQWRSNYCQHNECT